MAGGAYPNIPDLEREIGDLLGVKGIGRIRIYGYLDSVLHPERKEVYTVRLAIDDRENSGKVIFYASRHNILPTKKGRKIIPENKITTLKEILEYGLFDV